ncbi:MAG: PDZ domain-containing protein [Verrucomicrobiae bacterium]|nr:PDZ domain-containing protein [Verrucomicrobiae bacterium]NNJ42403.1 PDZ domain-containing protein [Akkermansiaceae bacterium]
MIHQKTILSGLLFTLIGASLSNQTLIAGKNSLWQPWPKDSYYADYPVFHWYPQENSKKPQSVYRFGPVGIGIDLTLPAFGMKVKNVEPGSPADATGKLKAGQIIETINGQPLKDIDPRVLLGNIITKTEATDGKVTLVVKDNPKASAQQVLIQIPVLGAYSKTWPLNCPKSDKIVRAEADYLAKNGNPLGGLSHDQGLLFLLSTGEEKDLQVARNWVQQAIEKTKDKELDSMIPWAIGYGAPGYCEYYLRTGDKSVLPLIKKIADQAARLMYNGGWNQRTKVNFKYGHMNAAGVHCTKFLLLAKECGVDVDEYTLQTSLKHFFRYVGRGNVPYGDGMPESGFVDNGKVGGLAFAMAAAASLTPDGEKSVYSKARDISATKSFYSTSWMLHGHTGGGIGEIWRSSAIALMHEKKPTKFREFVDNRTWHLDLSRRFDGSICILRDTDYSRGYDIPFWGSGYAMTYTVPRKTLRMTGAPPSKYSVKYQLPVRPWGNEADDVFYSLKPAPTPSGKVVDVDAERLKTDASWPILRKVNQPDVTDETLLMYCGHPEYNVRQATAKAIRNLERDSLIPTLLNHQDPRVRQTGLMVICIDTFGKTTIPTERITSQMFDRMTEMIADPNESWWVIENAMMGLSLAKPEQIAPSIDILLKWMALDDWWMQRAAMSALAPLASDPKYCAKIVPAIANLATKNTVGGAVEPLKKIVASLSKGSPEVKKIAKESFAKAYQNFPLNLTAPGGADMQNVIPHLHGDLATAVTNFPGGFDELYQISRKIMPNEALPYKHLYFKTDFEKFGPDLAAAMPQIVIEDVIPQYLGENLNAITQEIQWAETQEAWRRSVFAVGALDGMVKLYNEISIDDYNWKVFGPNRETIKWDYHSYAAPNLVKNVHRNSNVYIDRLRQGEEKFRKVQSQAKAHIAKTSKYYEEPLKKAKEALAKNKNANNKAQVKKCEKSLADHLAKIGKIIQSAKLEEVKAEQAMLQGTLPKGMEAWFKPEFNPRRAGWKHGLAPFANTNGEAKPVEWRCKGNFCGCGELPNTLWEKDVLLMRTVLKHPPLKPGYRYRVLLGGNIHSKQGGPVTIYINGKPVHQQGGFGGRLRGKPRGFFIDKKLLAEFKTGKVLIGVSAIKSKRAYLSCWLEEMKMPTIGEKEILNALTRSPMMCSEWQQLQDPINKPEPNEGKYHYNGRFIDNARLHGQWAVVDQIQDIADFTGPRPDSPFASTSQTLTILPQGKTSRPKWIWSKNTLMALDKKEALDMRVKKIEGKDYLLLQGGGFSKDKPKGWQPSYLVMEKR